MFGFLKKKKDDDFGDIRSNVLGSPMDDPDFPPRKRYESFPPRGAPPGFEDPLQPQRAGDDFENERPRFGQPPGFGDIDVRDTPDRRERFPRTDYDVADRLNLIESQLAAIRSMTETINERLKNLETKLGYQRRY